MKKIIKYVEKDGLLYPELKTGYQDKIFLSKYGRMRKNFLKNIVQFYIKLCYMKES